MKLKIDDPCPANWEQMKIGLHARFCDSCEKNVYDFTDKNRAEIITHLLSNPNERTCGRLRPDQFDFKHEDIPVLVKVLEEQRHPNRFLIFALVCISLSACGQDNTHYGGTTLGEPALVIDSTHIQPADTLTEDLVGKVAIDTTTQHIPTNCPSDMNTNIEVMQGEVIIQGDISVPEPPPVLGQIEPPLPPEPAPTNEQKVYQFVDKMPEYPGGLEKLMQDIKSYFEPKKITEEGTIYVRFIVNEDGKISTPEFLRINGQLHYLKPDVIQLLSTMTWIPGENNGKKVKVYYTIPIRFMNH